MPTATTSTVTDPRLEDIFFGNYETAKEIAGIPYGAYTGQRIAPFGQYDLEARQRALALSRAGLGQADIRRGMDYVAGGATTIPEADISQYMSPYQEAVISKTLEDMQRAQAAESARVTSKIPSGVFGGDRHGLVESEMQRNYLDRVASTTAGLRDLGYQRGTTDFHKDMTRRMLAGQAYAGLAPKIRELQGLDINVAGSVAERERALAQAKLGFEYGDFVEERDWPLRQLDILQSAAAGIPVGQTTTIDQPRSSLGLAGGALGGALLGGSLFSPSGLFGGTSVGNFLGTGGGALAGSVLGGLLF